MLTPIGPHVYFVEAENGLVKIGYSANVALRLRALLTTSATPLKLLGWLPGGTDLERDLHDRLVGSRSHGEWFRQTPDLVAVLATIERPAAAAPKTAGKRGEALMAYLERMKRGEVVRPMSEIQWFNELTRLQSRRDAHSGWCPSFGSPPKPQGLSVDEWVFGQGIVYLKERPTALMVRATGRLSGTGRSPGIRCSLKERGPPE